jgi:hypothetical protein
MQYQIDWYRIHGVLSVAKDERERKLSAVFHAGEDKRSGEK